MFLFFLVASIVVIGWNVAKSPVRSYDKIAELSFKYLLFILVGMGGSMAFFGHIMKPDYIASQIGWPTGSPFQLEVAFANLAFGVLGLLSLPLAGNFRIAAAIGNSVFLLGCAYVHLSELFGKGNLAPLNAGPVLWISDLFVPLMLLFLAGVEYRRLNR